MKTKEISSGKVFSGRNKITCSKLCVCFYIISLALLNPGNEAKAASQDTLISWSAILADNLMAKPSIARGAGLNNYVYATALKGLRELWKETGDTVYFQYINTIVDRNLSYYEGLGSSTHYDMDYINGASMLLFVYSETGNSKYIPAIDSTLKYLNAIPRTPDGGILHKALNRLQLDDLYMIGPFMAEYGAVFNKPEVYKDGVKQAMLFKKYMRDTATGLMYHAWYDGTAGSNVETTPFFWGRGIGWVAMALVDMLDFMPEQSAESDSIIAMFQDLSEAVSNVQDTNSGVWWQIVDKWGEGGNYLESSTSCMFVYAIQKGIKLGYLDNSFLPCVEKGKQGIRNTFVEKVDETTINIKHTCSGQAPFFDYDSYFINKSKNDHAVGPFIGLNLSTLEPITPPVDPPIDPAVTGIEVINSSEIVLSNYPNPFSNSTSISLTLPETEYITLDVYNMQGQRVERLYQGDKVAGTYSFTFNSSENSNNVYFYSLQAGDKVVVKKMMLIK